MKIAVPWPIKKSSQPRVKEALSFWENKDDIVICSLTDEHDSFFNDYNHVVLSRNSCDIGTKTPKCYISDMVKSIINKFPNEDWYGFGNSDCVPVGNLLENSEDRDILIFHRTDIKEWENRLEPEKKDELKEMIWKMRQVQSDKHVARKLNRMEATLPEGENEWTYLNVQKYCEDQGSIFIHGQDLYLFRENIVNQVIDQYLSIQDPILGTGAFDPRLTYWCMKNHNSCRVLNKLFHKKHDSEWSPDEIEFEHNGGILTADQWPSFFEDDFLIDLSNQGHRGSMPGWFMNAIKSHNLSLWERIIAD